MQTNTEAQKAIAALTPNERKDARSALGLTQMDIAMACGVQLHTVRNWERGALPQAHRADAYAEALRLPALATHTTEPKIGTPGQAPSSPAPAIEPAEPSGATPGREGLS